MRLDDLAGPFRIEQVGISLGRFLALHQIGVVGDRAEKDAEAREILKSMQHQCGIKNLMIDPQVQGTGTFLFNQVPCRQAFTIVLQSMGLAAQTYSHNIVSVGAAEH